MWEAAAYAATMGQVHRDEVLHGGRIRVRIKAAAVPRIPWTPERVMLRALLEEAIQCAEGRPTSTGHGEHAAARLARKGNHLVQDAREWIAGCPVVGGYTFDEVCGHLGLDADATRRAILGRVAA